MKAFPNILISSRTDKSAMLSISCNRSNAPLLSFDPDVRLKRPQKPTGTLQARCAVVAPYFIWKDAVPVGAANTHDIWTFFCFSLSLRTAASPPSLRVACSRRERTKARSVVDFPDPAPPVRINRNGFVSRRIRWMPDANQTSRSRAFCSTMS